MRYGMRSIAALSLLSASVVFGDQNIVKNGSLEAGAGPSSIDPQVADKWTESGVNIERSPTVNFTPVGDGHALKAFGDGDSTTVAAFQEITGLAAGNSVSASVKLYSPVFDKLSGSGQAGLVIEFLNQFGGILATHQSFPFNSSSPADTWITASIGPVVAPGGALPTTKVRITCRLNWSPGDISGAVYWDDAQLTVNGGPDRVMNGNFETAGPSPGQSPVGIDDWNGFNDQEKSSDVAEHGLSSLKLGTREAYSGLYQNMGTLTAGDHLLVLGFVYNPSSDPLTGNSRAGLKLEFDPSGATPPPEENLPFDQNTAANTWVPVALNTTVPTGVTLARVTLIFVGQSSTTGSVYFENASAVRGSVAGNQLLNSTMESGLGGPNGITSWTEFGNASATCQLACFEVPTLSGDCAAKGTGTSVSGIYQEFVVTPGESLNISCFLRTPDFDDFTGPGAKAGVKVEWFVGGVPADIDIGVPNASPNTIGAGAATNTWLPVFIDYTMPPNSGALARYTMLIEKGGGLTGRVYFDSCEAIVLNRFDGADVDGDDDEDLLDFAELQRCFAGPGGGTQWNCTVFDSDSDNDIDINDWNFFEPRMTGP